MTITVETLVESDLSTVWNAWNNPADIERWNAPSDDGHTTARPPSCTSGWSEVDEEGGIVVEMRCGEEGGGIGGDEPMLAPQVGNPDTQNRTLGSFAAERLEVGLAQWPLPGEQLVPAPPGEESPRGPLGHAGQRRGQVVDFFPRHHDVVPASWFLGTGRPCAPGLSGRAVTGQANGAGSSALSPYTRWPRSPPGTKAAPRGSRLPAGSRSPVVGGRSAEQLRHPTGCLSHVQRELPQRYRLGVRPPREPVLRYPLEHPAGGLR